MGHATCAEEAAEAGRARHGAHLRRAHERHELRHVRAACRARILRRRAARAREERRSHRARRREARAQSEARRGRARAPQERLAGAATEVRARLRRAVLAPHQAGGRRLRLRLPRGHGGDRRAGNPLGGWSCRATASRARPPTASKRAPPRAETQIGLWSSLSSNYTVEVIAGAGFDWILIDLEHSPADLESVLGQPQAAAPYDTTPVVRVPWNNMVTIKRYLDIGAQTLLIPQVTSAEEARNAVAYTRYPTGGVRGVAGATRATRFGRVKDYFKKAQGEICVLVQVESGEGLEAIEAIGAVDGIDGVFVGPADLHAALGYAGERAHADVMPRIEEAIPRFGGPGRAPGIPAEGEETARRWLALGALFVA